MKKYKYFVIFTLLIFILHSVFGQDNLSFTVKGVTFEMIYVEGGSFVMGCTQEQGNCYPGERPIHNVTLTDFYIGEFQVTQELWYVVMGSTLRSQLSKMNSVMVWGDFTAEDYSKVIPLNGEGNKYPMYLINYDGCELFCHRLNKLLEDQLPEGYRFRIPTEAQWEYAARGGNKSKNYTFSGSNNLDDVGWHNANSEESTSIVGKKKGNELGIYDMSGNVWEWCRDRYGETYYSNSSVVNPKGPEKGAEYVLRGGSWNYGGWSCRIATRHKDGPTACTINYGFRLCLEPPSKVTGTGILGYTGSFTTARLSSGKNLAFKVNNCKFEMVFVEGATFTMGCDNNNTQCDSSEKPAHNRNLSNYYIGKYEVTQELWFAVMGTTVIEQRDLANSNWSIYGANKEHPIYYVSYAECEAFCEKLNNLLYEQLPEGYSFVLPTEAQWEYAARGGKKSKNYIYSGNNKVSKVVWWNGNSGKKINKVGQKASNELGLYDMSGNVWEWCKDWYANYVYSSDTITNPQGPETGTKRVVRGGSWNLPAWHSRVFTRSDYEPQARSANLGFRIALEPPEVIPHIPSAKNHSFRIDEINFEMVFIEGGTFIMGCKQNFNDCFDNEEPTHTVTVSDFYLGKFQVTQQLWTKLMGEKLSYYRNLGNPEWELYGEGVYYPMYYISYTECEEFCSKLNEQLANQLPEGYKFDLPTEAQWEYAARGGKKSKGYLYSGSDNVKRVAWFMDNSNDQTHKVGLKKGNELGIYDMSGNLWEWCKDYFDGNYYFVSPAIDPTGPTQGFQRALRGGSWRSVELGCRVSCRYQSYASNRASNCGFRLALVKEK